MSALEVIAIEDDFVDTRAIQRALAQQHVELTAYDNATSALTDPRLAAPDGRALIVLLDLNLPAIDGLAFLRRLRANPGGESVPVLALTTSDDQRDRTAAFALGVSGYFIKPLASEELSAMLASIVSYWHRSRFPMPAARTNS